MENTLKNIQTVAFFFFLVLGIGYLLSSLLVLSGNLLPVSGTLKQALFLPFLIMSIAYAASSVLQGLASEGKNTRIQTASVIGVAALISLAALLIHFGVPNIAT